MQPRSSPALGRRRARPARRSRGSCPVGGRTSSGSGTKRDASPPARTAGNVPSHVSCRTRGDPALACGHATRRWCWHPYPSRYVEARWDAGPSSRARARTASPLRSASPEPDRRGGPRRCGGARRPHRGAHPPGPPARHVLRTPPAARGFAVHGFEAHLPPKSSDLLLLAASATDHPICANSTALNVTAHAPERGIW